MMDIDHFKRFNDNYGHDIGDKILIMVANTMMSTSRPLDDFGRWGGEEFIGILRNVEGENLKTAAERLRILIKESFLSMGDEKLQVTMSLGGTLAREDDTVESVVKRADVFLYGSKQDGRDRVTTDTR
jgi:diguanylate cyclase (GGDEF)-like protein